MQLSDASATLHMIWQSHLKLHLIGLEFFVKSQNGKYSCAGMCPFPPLEEQEAREKQLISILDFIEHEWWSDHMLILVGE